MASITNRVCNCAVQFADGTKIGYEKLCICIGAEPKLLTNLPIFQGVVYGLRDMDSAQVLAEKLRFAKRVVIVGNGGIALELIQAVN
jgi:pyruvate/2-oxoglutarate dehydrogenase complex dihydrolipoamide dehydrogenase (E3) component